MSQIYLQVASSIKYLTFHQGTSDQYTDSAWPPRNEKCFAGLSRFVERCNDLLDLVETTHHFLTLQEAAKVGGAGSTPLDGHIADIHQVGTFFNFSFLTPRYICV